MPPTVTTHETFLSFVLTCSLKGTMLLLLVGVIALLTSSASRRHFIWMMGFLCLGVLLLLEPFVPHWGFLPNWDATSWANAIRPWILPVWGVGAVLFCGKVLLGLVALLRIERSSTRLTRDPWDSILEDCRRELGIQRPVRLLKFPGRIMPMTWGVLRNFVVLPSSAMRWSGQRLRAVLMHELAHVRRGDYLASLFRDAVCTFYWFHPLIWWAAREMDEDREEASDDIVLATGQRPASYAEHLATIATRGWGRRLNDPRVRPKVALAEKPLLVRVRSILTPWKSRHPITWPQRISIALAMMPLMVGILLVGPRSQDMTLVANKGLPASPRDVITPTFEPVPGLATNPADPATPTIHSRTLEAVVGWTSASHDWALSKLPDNEGGSSASNLTAHLSSADHSKASHTRNDDASSTATAPLAASGPLATSEARQRDGGAIIVPPAEYSTSPPEESDEGPEAIDIGEVMASFENVGHIGVDDFDLGQLGDTPDESPSDSGGFDLGDFGFNDGTSFSTAGLTTISPVKTSDLLKEEVGSAATENAVEVEKDRGGASAQRLTSTKVPLEVAAQDKRPDPGLETRIGIVKSLSTGAEHLAITFRRKASSPTASFRFEASPDLQPGSWDFNPDHFIFAGARSINGNHEATIVLSKAMPESPFRFLRIRSTSAVSTPTPDPGEKGK